MVNAQPITTNYPWGKCENFNLIHINETRPATHIVVSLSWNMTLEPRNCTIVACKECTDQLINRAGYDTLNIMYNMYTTPRNTKRG